MSKLTSGQKFQGFQNGIMQITAIVGTGDVTLEALAGGKNGTAVAVTDGIITADGISTFYAVSSQWFQVTLTGNAQAWLEG